MHWNTRLDFFSGRMLGWGRSNVCEGAHAHTHTHTHTRMEETDASVSQLSKADVEMVCYA